MHNYGQRLEMIWGRSVNRVHVLDFIGLTEGMRRTLADRLRMDYTGDEGHELFTKMGLDVADTLCFQLGGAKRRMTWSERVIPDKGDLRDYWIEISSNRDFLGPAPSYVFIQDPMRRLCHRMISCIISGRGQAPEKVIGVDLFYLRSMDQGTANVPYLLAQYLFRHAEGRKSGARLSGGHFIGRLAAHFGLVSDHGLRGFLVVTHKLPLIDLHELRRLNICERIGDIWAWVAPGLERQPDVAVGATRAAEDAGAGTSTTTTCPQDYVTEDCQARGGCAGVTTEHCRAAKRC
ncbi:hypothetical protein Tco_1564672 [Tanacetum coccineum]